jgi:hypothetical protein
MLRLGEGADTQGFEARVAALADKTIQSPAPEDAARQGAKSPSMDPLKMSLAGEVRKLYPLS